MTTPMKKPNRNRKSSRPHNLRRQARTQRAAASQRHLDAGHGYGARVAAAVVSGGLYVRAELRRSPSTTTNVAARTAAPVSAGRTSWP